MDAPYGSGVLEIGAPMTALSAWTATEPPTRLSRPQVIRLLTLTMAQFVVAMDGTVVMVAIPAIEADLHFGGSLEWVLSSYVLAFGACLLVGGRIADLVGHRPTAVAGLLGFAVASAAAAVATTPLVLILARAGQGVCAALLAPAALGMLTTGFRGAHERTTAFAAFAAVGTIGSATGLLVGGVLTSYLSWRWTMWILVPMALAIAAAMARFAPRRSGGRAARRALDAIGAALSVAGLGLIVLGTDSKDGWSVRAIVLLLAGLLLLAGFAWWEHRTRHPLLPPTVLARRSRVGAYLAAGFAGASMLSMFYFIAQFTQAILGYSALQTGLLFLPNNVMVLLASTSTRRLLPRFGPKIVGCTGGILTTSGIAGLGRISEDTSLAWLVGLSLVMCFGIGLLMVTVTSTALGTVDTEHAGVASAVLTALQQVGGAVGLGLAATLATVLAVDDTLQAHLSAGLSCGAALAACAVIAIAVLVPRHERWQQELMEAE